MAKHMKNITAIEAHDILSNLYTDLHDLIVINEEPNISEEEIVYFNRGFKSAKRIAQFYGTPKVHKKMEPFIRFSPVNSGCGTISAVASKYVDYYLQKLVILVSSFAETLDKL